MGFAKCGCGQWETPNGDMEEVICDRHAGPTTCYIGDIEDCKYFHIESEDEAWCEHPDLDMDIDREYCPRIVERIMEDWE
jgi:hypothetical protein